MSRLFHPRVFAAAFLLVCGCFVEEDARPSEEALSHPGPWSISQSTLAAGDDQYVTYTGAGLWNDGKDCSGGIGPGASILRAYLLERFPQIDRIGGYNCRRNTGSTAYMSIHAVGRALDIMLPTSGGAADNDLGDPIGAWLIENAEVIGIQYIIWDQWTWMAARTPGQKGRMYTGPNPHVDHLHIELSAATGANTTDWFSGLVPPPDTQTCDPLPPAGGTIDDLDPCFALSGPANYWRIEQETGFGGSLLWTNAWMSATPSNWARWSTPLAEGGDYEVEVYLTAPFAVYGATRYAVRHAGMEDTVFVDQAMEAGSTSAWVSLGVYAFAAGDDQWVSVYDNVSTAVPSQQHIVVDAVRLRRIGTPDPGEEPPITEPEPMTGEPDPDVDPGEAEPEPPVRSNGGRCAISVSSRDSLAPLLGVLVACVALRRRRRIRR